MPSDTCKCIQYESLSETWSTSEKNLAIIICLIQHSSILIFCYFLYSLIDNTYVTLGTHYNSIFKGSVLEVTPSLPAVLANKAGFALTCASHSPQGGALCPRGQVPGQNPGVCLNSKTERLHGSGTLSCILSINAAALLYSQAGQTSSTITRMQLSKETQKHSKVRPMPLWPCYLIFPCKLFFFLKIFICSSRERQMYRENQT